jgi:hypothetical protein
MVVGGEPLTAMMCTSRSLFTAKVVEIQDQGKQETLSFSFLSFYPNTRLASHSRACSAVSAAVNRHLINCEPCGRLHLLEVIGKLLQTRVFVGPRMSSEIPNCKPPAIGDRRMFRTLLFGSEHGKPQTTAAMERKSERCAREIAVELMKPVARI